MILHLTEACGAGVARHLALLLPALRQRGVDVGLLLYGNRFDGNLASQVEKLRGAKIPVYVRPCRFPLLKGGGILREVCRATRPVLLHAHAFRAGVAARLQRGIPVCYSPHAFAFSPSVFWMKRAVAWSVERVLASRTLGWVFVHPAEDLLGCPAERSHCISNGVPEVEPYAREEARRLLEIPQEEKCIAAPCRLAAQKNLPTLLRALALLPNDVTLRIYGSGALRDRLLRLARTLGIEGRVRFHAETDDLPRKMRAFDVVALPSLYEGCSYVLLETLAAGVPLVASDIPANHLTAETDKTVRYFPPLDARLLAAQLTDALAAPATRPLRPFTLEAQADALAGMYESLVR